MGLKYVVKHVDAAAELGWLKDTIYELPQYRTESFWMLFAVDGDTVEYITDDRSEPEDNNLVRDWKWLPDFLNEKQARIEELEDRLRKSMTYDGACGLCGNLFCEAKG